MGGKDDAVRFGVIPTLEHAVLHLFTLGSESLYGVKDGYFNVAVAQDNPKEARLLAIIVHLVPFRPHHPFHIPAPFLHPCGFCEPTVMVSLEVFRADVLDGMYVLSAFVNQTYRIAPQPVILRLIAVAFRYLVRLPAPVEVEWV